MGRSKIPIEEEKVEELASVGCSAEEIASLLTPPGSKRPIDHRTIERRFAPVDPGALHDGMVVPTDSKKTEARPGQVARPGAYRRAKAAPGGCETRLLALPSSTWSAAR